VAKVFSDYLTNSKVEVLIWTGAALYPAGVDGALGVGLHYSF
jgi:hypothetical protein